MKKNSKKISNILNKVFNQNLIQKIVNIKMPEVMLSTIMDSANKRKMTAPLESILTEFEFVRVLNENSENKLMIIHALKRVPDESKETNRNAVLIFEKPHFGLDETKSYLELSNEHNIDIDNDIYKKLSVYPNKPYNSKFFLNFPI